MEYREFYEKLFVPLEQQLGPVDPMTIVAIVGFDAGGPLSFCTFSPGNAPDCITYVSCELAVREEQLPSEFGRYELLATCDDEMWVRSVISEIGRMSLDIAFGDSHTLDISPWVGDDAAIQGVVFEKVASVNIEGEPFGVLRVVGVSRAELEHAQEHGVEALVAHLQAVKQYPCTRVQRESTL